MDHFDVLAPLYDRLFSPPAEGLLGEFVGLPLEGMLLDVGGGTGRISQQFSGQTGGVVVLDRSMRMLQQARGKARLDLACGSSEDLPFPDGSFACVLVVDAFHHFARQEASLADLWRIVRPGGRLVIEEPDIDHSGVKLIALLERLALFTSHFVRAEEIAARLQAHGATTEVFRSSYNAWVIGEKTSPS
jgi:ubiquinone/menaquinone biosynthesis C-methylase UbiE